MSEEKYEAYNVETMLLELLKEYENRGTLKFLPEKYQKYYASFKD